MTVPYLMNCSHCDNGWCLACIKKLGEENERLCRLLTAYDSISPCDCCDMKLGWKYAGDGTCCIEIETGKPHQCPVEWGKFPEGTYRFQEARAIAAAGGVAEVEMKVCFNVT